MADGSSSGSGSNLRVRRARVADATSVRNLARAVNGGEVGEAEELVLSSLLALAVTDSRGELVAFLALSDAVPKGAEGWRAWSSREETTEMVWVQFSVVDPIFEGEAMALAVRAAFAALPRAPALLSAHRLTPQFAPLAMPGAASAVGGDENGSGGLQAAHWMRRGALCPSLRVRAARVEDHDDLVPLLEARSEVLREAFGDFFLADVLAQQTERTKTLVLEASDMCVGLLTATSEVDLTLLRECFFTQPFGGLARPEADGGGDNAFAVTLFCVDAAFEAHAQTLLQAAFAAFPDRDYCVVTLPHAARDFSLLSEFAFARPQPRCTLPHALRVTHRLSAGPLCPLVRPAEAADQAAIASLLCGVPNASEMLALLNFALRSGPEGDFAPFVISLVGSVVGFAVVQRAVSDLGSVRAKFDLAATLEEGEDGWARYGELVFFALSPLLAPRAKSVHMQLLRAAGVDCLLYRVTPRTLVQDVLEEFVQVRPRRFAAWGERQDESPLPPSALALLASAAAAPPADLEEAALRTLFEAREATTYALFAATRRVLCEPRHVVNARVVVLGASECGLGALETLLTQPRLHMRSLTLVAADGLAALNDNFAPLSPFQPPARLASLGLLCRARVVPQRAVGLDAARKCLVLADKSCVFFDALLLAPGLQDQTALNVERRVGAAVSGVFSAGDRRCWERVMELALRPDSLPALVYGATARAVAALSELLRRGVPATRLVWLVPDADAAADWCGGNHTVHSRVVAHLSGELGVTYIENFAVESVEHAQGVLTRVVLRRSGSGGASEGAGGAATQVHYEPQARPAHAGESSGEQFDMACSLLVGCDAGDVDPELFRALLDNGLVFDGRLVVDSAFRTCCAGILAAGPVARFSRACGAALAGYAQERWSSHWLGQQAAQALLRSLESSGAGEPAAVDTHSADAKALAVDLCGGLAVRFAARHASAPARDASALETRGTASGDCELLLSRTLAVESVTCVGPAQLLPSVQQLSALVGLPSSYLGDLPRRFAAREVNDLAAFLAQPWLRAYASDAFAAFRARTRASLVNDEAFGAVRSTLAKCQGDAHELLALLQSARLPAACAERVGAATRCFAAEERVGGNA